MNTNGHESVGRSSWRAPHYRSRRRTFGWDSGNCFGEGAPSAALGTGFTNTRDPRAPQSHRRRLSTNAYPIRVIRGLSNLIHSCLFVFIRVDSWLLKLFESDRGSDPALQTSRPQSTEHFPRLFPRMGAGRVRFFSADIRDRADGA